MEKPAASEETIKSLHEDMGKTIESVFPIMCDYISSLEDLSKIDIALIEEIDDVKTIELWKILLRLEIFRLLLAIQLSSFLRANFRAESNAEKRFNLKHIVVITIEGYRYLFGKKKDRSKAVWTKLLQLIVRINDEDLTTESIKLKCVAKDFEYQYMQGSDKDARNIFVHYDSDPLLVYDETSQLCEDYEAQRASAFLKILEVIAAFVYKITDKFKIPLICSFNDFNIDLWQKINRFPDNEMKVQYAVGSAITSYSEKLDGIIKMCNMPKFFVEQFNSDKTSIKNFKLDNKFVERFKPIIESMYPSIHIHFIYLDLGCAIKAYLTSSHFIEKQINLMRINVVVYEGFGHIYGFEEIYRFNSFWYKYIYLPLKDSTDPIIIDKLTNAENVLKELSIDENINNPFLRELFVHLRYKERDNIIPLFHQLIESNPLVEMSKALKLLNIIPTLIELNSKSLTNVGDVEIQRSNVESVKPIDNIISLVETISLNLESKQEIITIMNSIKTNLLKKKITIIE